MLPPTLPPTLPPALLAPLLTPRCEISRCISARFAALSPTRSAEDSDRRTTGSEHRNVGHAMTES
jgi:hypothetical protein